MNTLKIKCYNYFIKTQIYVSFCGTALCYGTMLWNKNVQWKLLLFIFFSTLFAYNWAVYNFRKREKSRELLTLSSGLFAFVLSFFVITELRAYLGLAILAIPTLMYNHTFIEIKFRTIPFLKIFLIAFVWSSTATILPWLNSVSTYTLNIAIQFIAIFLFVISIVIPFDIRDVNSDHEKLKTLPQFIGIKASKQVAYVVLIFSGILITYLFCKEPKVLASFYLTQIATTLCIYKSAPIKSDVFYSIWVESLCLLPCLFYLLLNI